MTIASGPGYDDILTLRIAGVGTTGGQYVYATRDSGAGETACLLPPSRIAASSIDVLGAVGSSGGLTLELITGSSAAQIALQQRTADAYTDAGGNPVRLALPALAADTTLYVTLGTGLDGELICIGGERMLVTAEAAGSIDVTRAQLGTIARPLPAAGAMERPQHPNPIVTRGLPSLIGAAVTIGRIATPAGGAALAEATIYRGVVTGWRCDGQRVQLTIDSALAALRERAWRVPSVTPIDTPRTLRLADDGVSLQDVHSVYDAELVITEGIATGTTTPIPYWRARCGDAWVVLTGTATEAPGLAEIPSSVYYLSRSIVQAGRGAVALPRAQWRDLFGDDGLTLESWEPLTAYTNATPGDVVEDMLTRQTLISCAGSLPSAYLDLDASTGIGATIDGALGIAALRAPESTVSGSIWWAPPTEPGKLLDILAREFLTPAGCALVARSDGTIGALDWGLGLGASASIGAVDLRPPPCDSLTDPRASLLRMVEWTAETAAEKSTVRIYSDFAAQTSQGGGTLALKCSWIADEFMRVGIGAWVALMRIFQRCLPQTSAMVSRQRAGDVEVGDVVLLTAPSLMDADGTLGVVDVQALVLDRADGLTADGASAALTLLLTGYGQTVQVGRWAPTARVSSYAAGVATVTASAYTEGDDAAQFSLTQRVILCDSTGLRVDTTSPPPLITVIAANALTVTFTLPGGHPAPIAGDVITVADWDDVSDPETAGFLADDNGFLGAGNDAPYRWI